MPLIAAAVALGVLLLIVFVMSREGDGPAVDVPPSDASTAPTTTGSATAAPTNGGAQGGRAPTAQDAAAFAESHRPAGARDVQTATADVDGDGVAEVVFASIASDAVRIDVARWDGARYGVVYTGQGGGAERIDAFTVTDYTGDQTREIATRQSIGAQGQSLSVWGWDGDNVAPLRASGGCWDGSHTFGVTGASIERGRIRATCDGSPLPTAAWPSDVYRWDETAHAWVFDHTEE